MGRVFLQDEKGEVYLPESLKIGILAVAWDMVQKAVETQFGDEVPAEVVRLGEERQQVYLGRDGRPRKYFGSRFLFLVGQSKILRKDKRLSDNLEIRYNTQ